MSEYGKCECCESELEDYEKDLLDCGHYACNSCTYSDKFFKADSCCARCRDKQDSDKEQQNKTGAEMSEQSEELQLWEKWKKKNDRNPCPFCNSTNTWTGQNSITGRWRVICDDCAAQGPITDTIGRSEAIKKWNLGVKRWQPK